MRVLENGKVWVLKYVKGERTYLEIEILVCPLWSFHLASDFEFCFREVYDSNW